MDCDQTYLKITHDLNQLTVLQRNVPFHPFQLYTAGAESKIVFSLIIIFFYFNMLINQIVLQEIELDPDVALDLLDVLEDGDEDMDQQQEQPQIKVYLKSILWPGAPCPVTFCKSGEYRDADIPTTTCSSSLQFLHS